MVLGFTLHVCWVQVPHSVKTLQSPIWEVGHLRLRSGPDTLSFGAAVYSKVPRKVRLAQEKEHITLVEGQRLLCLLKWLLKLRMEDCNSVCFCVKPGKACFCHAFWGVSCNIPWNIISQDKQTWPTNALKPNYPINHPYPPNLLVPS